MPYQDLRQGSALYINLTSSLSCPPKQQKDLVLLGDGMIWLHRVQG